LRRETLNVEPTLKELSQVEDERPGKGVDAEGISREEIHEISQKETVDSSRDRWRGESPVEDEHQDDVRTDPLNGKVGQQRCLEGQEKDS
jgi:hypothetical protein